jgi:endonuclease/exonuclease/phosphatase family metal-dependent hydrolase
MPVVRTADGRDFIDLTVLIYNVEGLPWPARSNRGPELDAIGDELARRRAAGTAPDIVLLQEVFSRRAAKIGSRSGYRNIVPGPAARDRRRTAASGVPADFKAARRLFKGERVPKLLGSGLQVLSDFPVEAYQREPFSANACAGYDCLANKGVVLARIRIPGVPTPVDVFTTHMNAQKASGVRLDRAHAAHRFQTDQSAAFLARARDPVNPLIFGGDFNMRHAPGRLDYFTYRKPYQIVHHYCTVIVSDCDVRMSWDGDAPWLDTQDLQGFDNGALIAVRPLRVEAKFDGPSTGGKLSDHDGYEVTYRLSWTRR